ncbi:hypothetical protein ACTL6U_09745 [Rhodovibrionaceae bacterium A322]
MTGRPPPALKEPGLMGRRKILAVTILADSADVQARIVVAQSSSPHTDLSMPQTVLTTACVSPWHRLP